PCASSGQAVANAHDEIVSGHADVVLAGGVESLSDIPILASRRLADILVEASKAKSLAARLRAFSRIRPRDLVPVSPAIAEPSTGESMGQSAEKMAKENRISREAQDSWALRSHQLAARATDDHRLTAEIVPWFPPRPGDPVVTADNGIRRDTSLEQMAKLKPVFDRRYGSVTAANSSPLTDGAAAVLLMSDAAARALGYTPLAYIRSYAVAAVDPGWQLLQAPIFAVPQALDRAGIGWRDLGVIEVHEAFAAQVLSNIQGWAAKGWEINEDLINVMGGSIAIGHPFGATGGRIVTTLANEMARRDAQLGLPSLRRRAGAARPRGPLPQADRRGHPRRVPRRRPRVRVGVPLPRRVGPCQDPARPPGGAARYSARCRRLPTAAPADRRARGARHHPRGQSRTRPESVPAGDRGRAGPPRHHAGHHPGRRAAAGGWVAAQTQAARRSRGVAAGRQPARASGGVPRGA